MNDWFRSLGVFGTAFAAVVVFTMGSATAIVPSPDGAPSAIDATPPPSAPGPAPSTPVQPTAVGGTMVVTGDREGTLVLERETTQDRYGLVGPDGRILFGGDPPTVARVQYDGLEFFVDPDECTVTPGERHDRSGVVGAEIRCEAIEDVRGGGVVGLDGRVGIAADLFGFRGDLPQSGGSMRIGEEAFTIPAARFTLPGFAGAFAGQIVSPDADSAAMTFAYDPQSQQLSVTEVAYAGDSVPVTGECTVTEREIGLLNPHTRVVELLVDCGRLDIPTLGDVPVEATVVAELVEPPR